MTVYVPEGVTVPGVGGDAGLLGGGDEELLPLAPLQESRGMRRASSKHTSTSLLRRWSLPTLTKTNITPNPGKANAKAQVVAVGCISRADAPAVLIVSCMFCGPAACTLAGEKEQELLAGRSAQASVKVCPEAAPLGLKFRAKVAL
jgi:hypothetical protein